MKKQNACLVVAILAVGASEAAGAQVRFSIGIEPFVFGGYPPPVIYQPGPVYYPPPVVYLGGGSWGGPHAGRGRVQQGHGDHGNHGDHDGRDRRR